MIRVPFSVAILAVLLVGSWSEADDKADATAKARAALALAQAQREREVKPVNITPDHRPMPKDETCIEDIEEAKRQSVKTGKPLVVLVGMVCDECPAIRDDLKADCVFCHAKEYAGNSSARIVVSDKAGKAWGFYREDIASGAFKPADLRWRIFEPVKAGGKWVQQCNGQSCQMVWVPD